MFFKAITAKVIYIYKTNTMFFTMNFIINLSINFTIMIIIANIHISLIMCQALF